MIKLSKAHILAHRGHWIHEYEKNSAGALLRALSMGFGIETDVRDGYLNDIIISHDPLFKTKKCEELSLDWLLNQVNLHNNNSFLALNVKSDGIQPLIYDKICKYCIENYFVFDMSIPDAISASGIPIKQFARASIYEPIAQSRLRKDGIWIDSYDNTYPSLDDIQTLLELKVKLAFVSPELHGRDREPFWDTLKLLPSDREILLCTDYPEEAMYYFGSKQ